FRTTNGGDTWEKVLYIDEHTGAIDLVMDPGDPRTLFAAMYQRRRTPWGFSASGAGSGLYRTTDGGATWTELTNGLPEGDKGRIGIDVYRRDGNLVYAVIESDRDHRGLYRSTDRGETWERVSNRNPRPMYFSLVRIDPNDAERIYLGGVELSISDDGGRSWHEGDGAPNIHVDHHALWIDPNDSQPILLGNDGGIASSFDRGRTWRHHNNLAVGQFYAIGVDMRDPYYVCGGLQDNSSWCGPSESSTSYGIRNEDWYDVSGGDGFYNRIDPTDPNIVFTESQGGNIARYDVVTGEAARIRPVRRPTPDDTTRDYRFNWSSPIHISYHDPATVFIGANHLMRSRDRGTTWEEASPDVTRRVDRDTLAIMGETVTDSTLSGNDGVSSYGTITVIGESPSDASLIYVGTDDGKVQVTRDGGATWTDVTANVPELKHGMVVSGIEPSRHAPGRVYLSFDGHYSDDYRPYIYVSEDYGQSWNRITNGLPDWSVNVVREHPRTPGLLFAGNEVGLFVSLDRGAIWRPMRGGDVPDDVGADEGDEDDEEGPAIPDERTGALPTVPVDDIVIHPRDNDLVVATHGRSIWILDDVTPLEHLASQSAILAEAAHLFPVQPATQRAKQGGWPFWGDRYAAPNPSEGALIRYHLARDGTATATATNGEDGDSSVEAADAEPAGARSAEDDSAAVRIVIVDGSGTAVRTLEAPATAGLHEMVWDLRPDPPYEPEREHQEEGEGGGRGGPPRGPLVLPGTYTVRIEAGAASAAMPVEVRVDPRITIAAADLRARQDALLELHALAKPLHEADLAATRADERIGAIRELLETSQDSALKTEADSLAEALEAAREAVGEFGRTGRLQGALEGVTARPTADQLWQIEEAWRELPAALDQLNDVVERRLAALSAQVYTEAARPEPIASVRMPARR
ncbi:MAG: hypothetical protein ACRELX_17355, partial [Longimicrobiales bacterium]